MNYTRLNQEIDILLSCSSNFYFFPTNLIHSSSKRQKIFYFPIQINVKPESIQISVKPILSGGQIERPRLSFQCYLLFRFCSVMFCYLTIFVTYIQRNQHRKMWENMFGHSWYSFWRERPTFGTKVGPLILPRQSHS